MGEPLPAGADLFYLGGGQDREQALIAPDLAAKGAALAEVVAEGAALLAVCGGYQLLGRYYRERSGAELPGIGLLPLHTIAGERRMIGDILIECDLEAGEEARHRRLREPRGTYLPGRRGGPARTRRVRVRQQRHGRERGLPPRQGHRDVPPRAAPTEKPVARRLADP